VLGKVATVMLQLYNTMTRKKENFRPIEKGRVRLYSCGLTVYDYAHVGNLRAYVFVDLLKRWLEYRGFEVKHVMNFTDVDDKTIRGTRREGVSLRQYTQKYIDAFLDDLRRLNIKRAQITPRATEHVDDIVKLTEILMEKGYGYRSGDGSIYYDISKFKDYGKLSKMKLKELKAGARVKVDEYAKDQACDFALWKAWDPDDGEVLWETRLGRGRPGWHIECSAMAMKYLGETLDIHTGGVDNIFPHHENEIAQSEAATEKRFVNYWLHNEHLLVKGERMGKSMRNFSTLRDLIRMGCGPLTVRYFLLSTHYRRQFNFSLDGVDAAKNALDRLHDFVGRLESVDSVGGSEAEGLVEKARADFENAMDDDLDISKALAAVFNLVKDVNKMIDKGGLGENGAQKVKSLLVEFDSVLGVLGGFWRQKHEELPEEIQELIKKREEARRASDWRTSDAIRSKLREMGIVLEDTPEGVRWKRER
jgi:cysteinyl-tRNA synthetase